MHACMHESDSILIQVVKELRSISAANTVDQCDALVLMEIDRLSQSDDPNIKSRTFHNYGGWESAYDLLLLVSYKHSHIRKGADCTVSWMTFQMVMYASIDVHVSPQVLTKLPLCCRYATHSSSLDDS